MGKVFWFKAMAEILPLESLVEVIVELLRYLAKKTDNKVDDDLVDLVENMLLIAIDKKQGNDNISQ